MRVEIVSQEDITYRLTIEVPELNYDSHESNFWMRLVMGDDWFQRVTSSLDFTPQHVSFVKGITFVVCEKNEQGDELLRWLEKADEQVEHGYTTMRG